MAGNMKTRKAKQKFLFWKDFFEYEEKVYYFVFYVYDCMFAR